ncbi:sodium channel subunit beta-3-like [Oreochromis aureus]|uniref:sodium channel subunit beta-3-like n=1 Tax=Oreochromis aureus TaxID=47969 RepID=UPI001954F97E|nr:sodium channel subunit beta-3-like [Oreochromis aureus]
MASVRFLLFLSLMSISAALQQDVQAKLGADVTLQCQITTDEIISVLKWSRPDLNTDGYVYFYRNKRSYENYQHPSFHGRVKLRDPEMKDGDVSVTLKNVTFNDTGIYECHVAVRKSGRSKRGHTEISHFIRLTVTGKVHKNMLEEHIMEREDADENTEVEQVETQTILVVAGVAGVAAVAAVAAAASLLVLLLKKQHLVKVPTEERSVGSSVDNKQQPKRLQYI